MVKIIILLRKYIGGQKYEKIVTCYVGVPEWERRQVEKGETNYTHPISNIEGYIYAQLHCMYGS